MIPRAALLAMCAMLCAAEPAPLTAILDHVAAPRVAQDLGGSWDCTALTDMAALPAADAVWRDVSVPGRPGEHARLYAGPPDVRKQGRVWFRTRFALSAVDVARAVDLHCERVNDLCLVVVNGTRVAETSEAWSPVRIPLGSAVRAGANELLLGVAASGASGALGHRPMGAPWFHDQFTGIPLPVHIEIHDRLWIEEVAAETHLAGGARLASRITLRNDGAEPAEAELRGSTADGFRHTPRMVTVPAGSCVAVRLEDACERPRLWWPHDPQLQYLDMQLTRGGRVVDALRTRFGFRELRVVGPDLLLNGVPVVQRRDSLLTYHRFAWQAELDAQIEGLRSHNYNTMRMHLGAMARVARRCDELGMLLDPEAAICQPAGHLLADDFWPAADRHLDAFVRSMRNNPSVVLWCISNEFGSVYMPGDDKIPAGRCTGAQVDAWQMDQIRRLADLDPTRPASASGAIGLGGKGRAGPAPVLSLHYAWQPWKLGNQLPQSADWLARGLQSWHGVSWDRSRPMLLSEDLFEPYCLKIPHGLSQWAGDAAYDPAGAVDAVRQAYAWFAVGNYRARVALWNPWGISGGPIDAARQPLLARLHASPLMPSFAIAWRGHERAFVAGTSSDRTIEVHHRDLRELSAPRIAIDLLSGGETVWSWSRPVAVAPGGSIDQRVVVAIPPATAPRQLTALLRLLDGDRELGRDEQRWMVLPSAEPRLPAATVWLGERAPAGATAVGSMAEALALRPRLLVITRPERSDREIDATLHDAIERGLHALWLAGGDGMHLPAPLQAAPRHDTAFAFIRSPLDPLCRDLPPELLMSWRPGGRVCAAAVPKTQLAGWQVLLDVGGPDGLSHAALMRRTLGAGTMTVCQLAILDGLAAGEPAAAELLSRIAIPPTPPAPRLPLRLFADEQSPLARAVRASSIAATAWREGDHGVLLADGAAPGVEAAVRAHCGGGGIAVLHLPDAALARNLGVTLAPGEHRHLGLAGAHPLSAGLSADDLWWEPESGYDWLVPAKTAGKPPIITAVVAAAAGGEFPFTPAGLAALPLGGGRLVIDLVRWSVRIDDQPVRSQRYLRTLLANCGADLGSMPPADYLPLTLDRVADTPLAGSEAGVTDPHPGWPGPGANDLRYFPVNTTGMDPRLHVPAPRVPLPAVMQLAGVPFRTIDRERQANDAIVPARNALVEMPASGAIRRLWLAGGAGGWIGNVPQLAVVWRYADGSSAESVAIGGDHLGSVLERTPMRRGVVGWSGPTPTRDDAVVWVWSHDNPQPGRPVSGLALRGIAGGVAIVAATIER
ncbi:MAG: hypothetical protein J0M02_08865 [Planctomycetes bacterium]|nr:hypothetical protein [Planctomycetota bacterium]